MSDKTLRQLTRAYAKGDLNREQYRKARADLINGILAGEITVPENDYPSLVKPRSVDDTFEEVTERKLRKADRDEYPDHEPAHNPPPAGSSRASAAAGNWPLLAGSIAGIILIPVFIYLLLPASSRDEEPGSGSPEPAADAGNTAEAMQEAEVSEARELVRDFLKERSWTRESIEGFIASWQTLPVDQRQAVRGSVEMSRLANAIYKQLLAEKALSNLDGGGQALEKQKLLVNFAQEMRIDDPRITVSEEVRESGTESGDTEPEQG